MLQQPAPLVTVGRARQPHPASPPPALALQRRLGPGAQLPGASHAPHPVLGSPPGHQHFSSRHGARPHFHRSPDGSPQPRFPELPATRCLFPGGSRHSAASGQTETALSRPCTSRVCWFGVRGDNRLEANSLLSRSPNSKVGPDVNSSQNQWEETSLPSPLHPTHFTLSAPPGAPLPPQPPDPLWVEEWALEGWGRELRPSPTPEGRGI